MQPRPRPGDPEAATIVAVERFNEAFSRHDIDAVMRAMSGDCVFDTTEPAPDGTRYEGQVAVRRAWEEFFSSSPNAAFEIEEMFACGDRCVVRWRYTWSSPDAGNGHVRGVDVIRVKGGLVAEKLSYVKG